MESSYLIKLSLILYKVTDSIPEGEPLRCCIREKANSILGNLVLFSENPVSLTREQRNRILGCSLRDIEALLAYLKVAGEQEWANKDYFLVLAKEYRQVAKEAEGSLQEKAPEKPSPSSPKPAPRPESMLVGKKRCKEILKLLENKNSLQVRDLKTFFPSVTKRTLRRDFEYLLKQGLVRRVGERSDIEYRLR